MGITLLKRTVSGTVMGATVLPSSAVSVTRSLTEQSKVFSVVHLPPEMIALISREHSARGQLADVQPFGGNQARGWGRKVTLKKMGARSCIAATKRKQIEETSTQVMARKRSKVADDCSGVTTRSARAKQQMKLR